MDNICSSRFWSCWLHDWRLSIRGCHVVVCDMARWASAKACGEVGSGGGLQMSVRMFIASSG
jgi:hypothetical protein